MFYKEYLLPLPLLHIERSHIDSHYCRHLVADKVELRWFNLNQTIKTRLAALYDRISIVYLVIYGFNTL